MQCPECGSRRFRVGVVLAGEVTCQFDADDSMRVLQPASLDSSWHPDAECSCLSCGWSGTALQAGFTTDAASKPTSGLNAGELEAIERELESGDCPEQLAEVIGKLVQTVRSLQNQLEIVRRVKRAKAEGATNSRDTTIL